MNKEINDEKMEAYFKKTEHEPHQTNKNNNKIY